MDSTNLETQRLLGFDPLFDNSYAIGAKLINLELHLHPGTHLTDKKIGSIEPDLQGHLVFWLIIIPNFSI